jgi:hypothetical protein
MAFCEALLLLRTSRLRRTAAVQQAIGIAAAELLEEIQQTVRHHLIPRDGRGADIRNLDVLLLREGPSGEQPHFSE